MKITLLAFVSVLALGLSACSNGGGGGGGAAPVKPNLAPATEVTQSFGVIQQAAPTQTTAGQAMESVRNQFAAYSGARNAAASKPGQDIRSSELKKLISNPQDCKMSLQNADPNAPRGTTLISLTITGVNCPLSASFYASSDSAVDGSSTAMKMDISFQVKTADAQGIIGAKSAKLAGNFSFGMSEQNTPRNPNDPVVMIGKGQFSGYVDTLPYGRVNLVMDLSADVKATQGAAAGSIVESTTFAFPDAAMNVNLRKVTTIVNQNQTVAFTANGAVITEQEYDEVLGSLSSTEGKSTAGLR